MGLRQMQVCAMERFSDTDHGVQSVILFEGSRTNIKLAKLTPFVLVTTQTWMR